METEITLEVTSSTRNPPRRHHYIPEFYTRRWCLGGPKLVQFFRPRGPEVRYLWVSPKQTGFMDRLYEVRGLPEERAQVLETEFFQPLDGRSAEAMDYLLMGGSGVMPDRHRVAWTRFILNVMMRNPEELEAFRKIWRHNWPAATPKQKRRYRDLRRPGMPATLPDYLRGLSPDFVERSAMRAFVNSMNLRQSSNHIFNMKWGALTFPYSAPGLLTSDRPIFRSGAMDQEDLIIAVPLSPKKLFFAVNSEHMRGLLYSTPPVDVAERLNRLITQQAHRYVYGTSPAQLPFVRQHMSTNKARVTAEGIKPFPHGQRINRRRLQQARTLLESR